MWEHRVTGEPRDLPGPEAVLAAVLGRHASGSLSREPGGDALAAELVPAGPGETDLASIEERADRYLLLRPGAGGVVPEPGAHPGARVGLKVRAFEVQPRLELKVCFERSPEGPEHWEKLLARRLPLGPAWSSVLAAHLHGALGAEETTRHPASPLDTLDGLEAWLAELGLALGRSVLLQKRIWKLPAPPALAVEVVDLRLPDGRPLRSVAIGAPTAALALRVARRLGLPEGRDASGPHVGGYPEALARLAGA